MVPHAYKRNFIQCLVYQIRNAMILDTFIAQILSEVAIALFKALVTIVIANLIASGYLFKIILVLIHFHILYTK